MTFCQHPVIASAIAYFKGARAQAPYVGWMLAERVWMMFSGVIVGFWVVRALGPEEFGHFSAASAVAAVFAGLAAMGLETVIVRRLSAGGVNPRVVLFTAASLRLGGSVAYAAICWVAAWLLFPGAGDVALMAFIVAAATVFRVTDVIGLWFQAENQYGRAARTRILIRVAGDAIRVFLILNHAPAVSFAIAMLLESMVASIVFIAAGRALLKLRGTLDLELARSLFADGRPVMIGALVAAMYARMDQLFLYNMGGAADNGYYAAAARISEALNVVLLSIGSVSAAHFGRLASAPAKQVDAALSTYYRSMTLWGLVVSGAICALAGPIVAFVYGPGFAPTAPILRVHAWTFSLVCTSVALEPWFYHHRKLGYFIPKTLLALLFSLPAVYVGTRFFGPVGTATAVVATYAVSVFVSNAVLPGVRDAFRFQVRTFRRAEGPTT